MNKNLAMVDGMLLEVREDWSEYVPLLSQICNGVGPASWPQPVRDMLDKLPFLLPASKVHDVDYEAGGTDDDRKTADKRFRRNCIRVMLDYYGPWWWRLWGQRRRLFLASMALILAAYLALRVGGGDAFKFTGLEK